MNTFQIKRSVREILIGMYSQYNIIETLTSENYLHFLKRVHRSNDISYEDLIRNECIFIFFSKLDYHSNKISFRNKP